MSCHTSQVINNWDILSLGVQIIAVCSAPKLLYNPQNKSMIILFHLTFQNILDKKLSCPACDESILPQR